MTKADITERVVQTAEDIEDKDASAVYDRELGALDVEVVASMDGSVKEVILTVAVGGPHIEVSSRGYVKGSWGGENHTTHYRNEEFEQALYEVYGQRFEERVM